MQQLAGRGVRLQIRHSNCAHVHALDAQQSSKKWIFGGGLLLNKSATDDRLQAERDASFRWELSDRERDIIDRLSL